MLGRPTHIIKHEKHLEHLLQNHNALVNFKDIIRDMKVKTHMIRNQFYGC